MKDSWWVTTDRKYERWIFILSNFVAKMTAGFVQTGVEGKIKEQQKTLPRSMMESRDEICEVVYCFCRYPHS